MTSAERYNRKVEKLDAELKGATPSKNVRQRCEKTGKVCFSSKQDARKSLTGGMSGKSMRVYACQSCGKLHITKDWANKRNTGRD